MIRFRRWLAFVLVMPIAMLAACSAPSPGAPDDDGAAADAGGGASLAPNDMTVCRFAGTGATFAADGERANFTCESPEGGDEMTVLAGDVDVTADGWMIDQVTVVGTDDGFETTSASMVPVLGIDLEDGTTCLFAGTGATFAIDGQRVNYTCGAGDDDTMIVLAGEIEIAAEGWVIEKAVAAPTEDGFEPESTEMAPIVALRVPASE